MRFYWHYLLKGFSFLIELLIFSAFVEKQLRCMFVSISEPVVFHGSMYIPLLIPYCFSHCTLRARLEIGQRLSPPELLSCFFKTGHYYLSSFLDYCSPQRTCHLSRELV